jgi:PIN domain nuclease of toxin-antitoxin system
MRLLLDTNAFIWFDSNPGKLSATALAALQDPANSVWFSVVSVWEIVIKAQLGKLTLRLPLADIVAQQQANGL